MKDVLQWITRAGAWVIILLLVGMMAFTFTGQDLNVTGVLAGRGGVGSYAGTTITGRDYGFHYNGCERQASLYRQQFKDLLGPGQSIDQFFNLDDCVRRSLQQSYILPTVGERMGLGASLVAVQKSAEEEAIQQFRNQQTLLEEDRMSARQIYETNLQNYPLDLRQRQTAIERTGELLNETIVLSDEAVKARWLAQETGVQMRVLRYNSPQLLAKVKQTIAVSEADVRAAYDEEQAEKATKSTDDGDAGDAKPKSFEDERPFVEDRLKTKLARKELNEIKEKVKAISDKSGYTIDAVAEALGLPVENAGVVKLGELSGVPAGKGTRANLNTTEFLKALGERRENFTLGPLQDGEFTVFVSVGELIKPRAAVAPASQTDEIRDRLGRDLTGQFYTYLMQEESLRGAFTVKVNANDVQR